MPTAPTLTGAQFAAANGQGYAGSVPSVLSNPGPNGAGYQGSAMLPGGTGTGTGPGTVFPGNSPYALANTNPSPGAAGSVGSQVYSANYSPSGTTTVPVFNANAALQDYQQKFAAYQSALAAANVQSDAKSQAAAQATADQAQKDLNASQQNYQQGQLKVQQTTADAANTAANAKLAAANGLSNASGSPQNAPGTMQPPPGWDAQTYASFKQANPSLEPTAEDTSKMQGSGNSAIAPSQNTLDYIKGVQGIQDERTQALGTFLQTANSMIIGLQSSEAALVNATTQQFQGILTAQAQSNASQLGAATEAAARTEQEYNQTGAVGTIASVISQGNQRLSDINSKMATTLADLDINFAKEEYSMMNDNFAKLDQSFTDRMTAFKDVHDAVATEAAAQLKAQQEAKTALDNAKLEASKAGAPASLVNGATNISDLINKAGDYMRTASGTLGDYLEYRNETKANGLVPIDYQTYKDQETAKANKEKINEIYATANAKAAADKAAGSSDSAQQKLEQQYRQVLSKEFSSRTGALGVENAKVNQANHLNSLITKYYDPKTGNYNIPTSQYAELALGLASLISPTGSTDSGERAAITAKTATSDLKGALQYITGIPQTGNTQEMIKNLVDSVDRQAQTATDNREAALQNMRDQAPTDLEQSRIDALNKSTKMVEYSGKERIAKSQVNEMIKGNTQLAKKASAAYAIPGATDSDVLQLLKLSGNNQ